MNGAVHMLSTNVSGLEATYLLRLALLSLTTETCTESRPFWMMIRLKHYTSEDSTQSRVQSVSGTELPRM